jgi:hypothetical protein
MKAEIISRQRASMGDAVTPTPVSPAGSCRFWHRAGLVSQVGDNQSHVVEFSAEPGSVPH